LSKIEEDGKSCLRRLKLYKRVVEPHKKKITQMFVVILRKKSRLRASAETLFIIQI
jgi:hypothetical protein